MPKFHEQFELQLDEAAFNASTGTVPIQIITPGWGSTGYYSEKVLEDAAPLFKAGTPMFLDHASESERIDRPVRSVKDIAATFTKDATWDPKVKRLVTEAHLVPGPYKEALLALRKTIGVSINGSATDITVGEAEGRQGPIVEGLAKIDSVDFVTRAGRGGKILLESALREHEVLAVDESVAADLGVDEATASDRMGHLRDVVRSTHGTDGKTAWVRDQDAENSTVWFDVHDRNSDGGSAKTFQQTYTVGKNDVDVALAGEPTEVRAVTNYVPVTRPDSSTSTTEADLEVTMGKIQIEESEVVALREKAGRADTLESENAANKARADRAEATIPALTKARALVTEANKDLAPAVVDRIVATATTTIPLTESGALDEGALKVSVDAARTAEEAYLASLAESAGAGQITGFGTVPGTQVEESTKPTKTPWGRPISKEA